MNLPETTGTEFLLADLQQGLCFRDARGRVLIYMEEKKIRVSSRSYFAAMSWDDFCDCYAGWLWLPVQKVQTVDEKKDEEYYAWRREKQ